MLRFLADENFDNDIIRGVLRHQSDLDIIRVQDIGLLGAEDSTILERAAQEQRLLHTHDVTTVTRHAYERLKPENLCLGWWKSIKRPQFVFSSKRFYY